MSMSRPSSTITAATLAGMGMSFTWELITTFTEIVLSAGLVAASVVFVSATVGYFKKENVLPLDNGDK